MARNDSSTSRRDVLRTTGTALAALGGTALATNAASAAPDFSVVTHPASDVNTTYATFNGELERLGGADYAEVWFRWGELDSTKDITASQTFFSPTTFSETVSGLTSGVTYEFRAEGESNEPALDSGEYHTFTTPS